MPHPSTTVKVTKIEPCGETKVCITMELMVDMHRLADVSSEMLQAAMAHVKAQRRAEQKKK